MKATIQDTVILRSIGPMEVAAYLRCHEWEQIRRVGDLGTVWNLPTDSGQPYEILLPLDHSVADYVYRMADVLNALSVAEARSQLQILSDLFQITSDVIRIGVPRTPGDDGSVALNHAVRMVGGARDLMLAAACAAIQPRAHYPSRTFAQAADYVSRLRLTQSEPGNFVLVMRSPVTPYLHTGNAPPSDTQSQPTQAQLREIPFERRVTLTLADALAATRDAVAQAGATGDLSPFTQAVSSGVSADLCQALTELSPEDADYDVVISVSWSPTRAAPAKTPNRFNFVAGTLPVLREAARLLRKPIE